MASRAMLRMHSSTQSTHHRLVRGHKLQILGAARVDRLGECFVDGLEVLGPRALGALKRSLHGAMRNRKTKRS